MSRRRRRRSADNPGGNPVWWQSAAMNDVYHVFFRDQIIKLALARFRWEGLPPTCDARFLEWQLLNQGVATIARPARRTDDAFLTLRAVSQGRLTAYGLPSEWTAQGDNGTSFSVSHRNGVLVWENMLHKPLIQMVDALAWDMSDIVRTKQVNRVHVKVPFVLAGPREMREQMVNLFSQKVGNEPGIVVTDSMRDLVESNVALFQTGVKYLGEELNADLMETWNMVYTMLGIKNLPFKMERQTADEIRDHDQPTELMTLGALSERRRAADDLNRRFGLGVGVYFNEDFESTNYNTLHNVQRIAELGLAGGGSPETPMGGSSE